HHCLVIPTESLRLGPATTELYTLSYTTLFRSMAAGEVQLGVFGVGAAAGEVAKGTMNVLAVDYKSPLMPEAPTFAEAGVDGLRRSEEHTSELQSRENLVCRLLLEKKKKNKCVR